MATSRPAQHVFRIDADLLEWLTSRIDGPLPHLIAVDGINGTGKSRLSRSLGEALSCPTIDCDDFIRDGERSYPAILDLDDLSRTLRAALGANRRAVVDGVLLLKVLDAIDIAPSTHIYVRHNWPAHSLTHHSWLTDEYSETQLIEEENSICRAAGIADDAPILARELIAYHKRDRPHKIADAIFDTCFNIEDDG